MWADVAASRFPTRAPGSQATSTTCTQGVTSPTFRRHVYAPDSLAGWELRVAIRTMEMDKIENRYSAQARKAQNRDPPWAEAFQGFERVRRYAASPGLYTILQPRAAPIRVEDLFARR